MSDLLPPPTGAGEASTSRAIPGRSSAGSPFNARKLSNGTGLMSQGEPDDSRPSVSDKGMLPVRNSVGKLVHPQEEGPRFSKDLLQVDHSNSPSNQVTAQPDKGAGQEGDEEKKKSTWDSARARFGNVLSARHNIRRSLSRSRLNIQSQQPTSPLNPTAATSLAGSALPTRSRQASIGVPSNSSPSKISSRFTSWRSNRKERGRESPQEQEGTINSAADEQHRSASSPPSQGFRTRINRFLRSGRHSLSSTASPTSSAVTAPSSEPGHLEALASTPDQTPPCLSSAASSTARGSSGRGSGLRKAVRRGVNSARRKVSVPFLSTPPLSVDVSASGAGTIEPPEIPQTVPLGNRGGPLRSPSGSQPVLSSGPGHNFLQSEAIGAVPNYSAPPVTAGNPEPEGCLERNFEEISMIQSPPMFPPAMEELPPISPWVKADGTKEWLKPFAVDEVTRDYASVKGPGGGQDQSDIYRAVASGSGTSRIGEGQVTDKGKGKGVLNTTDHLKLPGDRNYLESANGKSIEVLEEEKRRKSRDTGIMGLDPEVAHKSDPLTAGLEEEDDDGEFTYASAMREIAGLDRFPKRPPLGDDANLDEVSVPLPECDYDLPLPNFRFTMLAEPSPSSNEPDASPCAASSSSTQGASGSVPALVGLASTSTQATTTLTAATTITTARTTTEASSTISASASISPPNLSPYHYQMLLSSKRPYLLVLQEISSGTSVKVTPQNNPSRVSKNMSTVPQNYSQTPAPGQTSPGPSRTPASVRFVSGNGLLACGVGAQEEDEDAEDEEAEGKGKRGDRKDKKNKDVSD